MAIFKFFTKEKDQQIESLKIKVKLLERIVKEKEEIIKILKKEAKDENSNNI